MSEKDYNFDKQMIEQLSYVTPPEEEIRKTNPWSKPIGFITWGFILTTFTFEFYIPAIYFACYRCYSYFSWLSQPEKGK
jgi:hypothetical protein